MWAENIFLDERAQDLEVFRGDKKNCFIVYCETRITVGFLLINEKRCLIVWMAFKTEEFEAFSFPRNFWS